MEVQEASGVKSVLSDSLHLVMDGIFQIEVLLAESTQALLVHEIMPLDK